MKLLTLCLFGALLPSVICGLIGSVLTTINPVISPILSLVFPGPVVLAPCGTITGSSLFGIDTFNGIPYAISPVGPLRLKPPQPISPIGTFTATGVPRACPEMSALTTTGGLPPSVVALILNSPLGQTATVHSEDCLTINIQRPSGAKSSSRLPVVFWIYPGGFEFGSTQNYDASSLILTSVSQNKPVMYVSVNYRSGGFGFLAGSKILADGSANLGLLDQRLALKWVADNIASFGGDPEKVTLWGVSSSAACVFDQMALYDGDNTYKGKPLFSAAIMSSGSVIPVDPVDCLKAEVVYETVVKNAGCESAVDTLQCLRSVSYETFLNAANSVPGISSYNSVALSYLPRPDGIVLTQSPDLLLRAGKYASIPFIIGDQEDEGTLFCLQLGNITSTAQLETYLSTLYFSHASAQQIHDLVALYPDDPSQGSPFRTGELNVLFPQFKRISALLGDATFTLARRFLLEVHSIVKPDVSAWSYLASYGHGTPILGTFHASDVAPAYGQLLGITSGIASNTLQGYYISFFNTMDPNTETLGLPNWPLWKAEKQLLWFEALANRLISDNFRQGAYEFLFANVLSLYI